MTVATEPLFALIATTTLRPVMGIPQGDRVLIDVTGGEFSGPKLSGRVLPSGGDWVALSAAGARVDVRLALESHDGVVMLFRYLGVVSDRGGVQRADVAGLFEVPAGPYGWLNGVLAIGYGAAIEGGARYEFFRFI
ncbi:MAG: DUF3237 domain-containing protein [Casimicrobiaceae bacterium]